MNLRKHFKNIGGSTSNYVYYTVIEEDLLGESTPLEGVNIAD
jgi:hypothetical protein